MAITEAMKQITECALALVEKQDKMDKKNFNYTKSADVQVKPQVAGQRVTFDHNGELVVLTNKGKMDAKGKQEVVMDGLFSINARDLAKLLSMVSEVKLKVEEYFRGSDGTLVTFFNPKQDIQDLIAEIKRKDAQCDEMNETIKRIKSMYLNLQIQLADFNRSRFFWERKFVVETTKEAE